MKSVRAIAFAALIALLAPVDAVRAQILRGEWVDAAKKQIDAVRKTDLRVIVLDEAGKPAPDAAVHVEMLRHDFRWGVRLEPEDIEKPDALAERFDKEAVQSCFNAISIERLTSWPVTEPTRGELREDKAAAALAFARKHDLAVRFGAAVSVDSGRMPDWAAKLDDNALAEAIDRRVKHVVETYAGRVDAVDIFAETLDRDAIGDRLGQRTKHYLLDSAKVVNPRARNSVAFADCFSGARLQNMIRTVTAIRDGFAPLDAISLDTRIAGSVVQAQLARSVAWIDHMGVPVTITGLEVLGPSDAAAAINLETALWVLFSTPNIDGVYFVNTRAANMDEEAGALLDARGNPTASGNVLRKMIRELWWSEALGKTDELGNARSRVFAGQYRLTAVLPDQTETSCVVNLPVSAKERIVILQPRPKAGGQR